VEKRRGTSIGQELPPQTRAPSIVNRAASPVASSETCGRRDLATKHLVTDANAPDLDTHDNQQDDPGASGPRVMSEARRRLCL
jgi:hypothetical protein